MLTLLKIFFFFILLVFVGGFISRYLLGRFFKKMRDRMNQQYNQKENERTREGDVYIDPKPKGNKKHFKEDDGEYVDYEDIDK